VYGWVKFEKTTHPKYEGARIIFSGEEKDLTHVRRILVFHHGTKEGVNSCETIYCDDDAYLCNDSGQTIERL